MEKASFSCLRPRTMPSKEQHTLLSSELGSRPLLGLRFFVSQAIETKEAALSYVGCTYCVELCTVYVLLEKCLDTCRRFSKVVSGYVLVIISFPCCTNLGVETRTFQKRGVSLCSPLFFGDPTLRCFLVKAVFKG